MKAPPPYLTQAGTLIEGGRIEEAQALLMRQIRAKPHSHAYYLLGVAYEALGQFDQAIYFARKSVAADPHDPNLVAGLAQRLFIAGQTGESLACLEAFSAAHPKDPSVLSARVAMLAREGRDEEAIALADVLRSRMGESQLLIDARIGALTSLGRLEEAARISVEADRPVQRVHVLVAQWRLAEAAAGLAELGAKFPGSEGIWTYYASTLNYVQDASLEETLRAHRAFGVAARSRLGPAHTDWNVSAEPDRKLRIGIVSPDLRQHAIVSFLAPLLENYDRDKWHITAYSTHFKQDAVSARLRTLVDQWRWLPTAHARLLVHRMREDRIDVAIELSGHTEGQKLEAMHLRPAPLQVTYLGYPNTTGLDTIDLRIVDSITDPPGAEHWATEKLARIDPCFLCFKPFENAPDLSPSPVASRDTLAFGSFNLPRKISPRTLEMWGRLLAAVPCSTLVLKHTVLKHQWMRDLLASRLVEAGIDKTRVTVLSPSPTYADHLAAYSQVDIALDTYPYHGTTTTCEAMWMGVPVVTLRGDRHAARVGCSLLSAVGLSDLIAGNPDEFVAIGTRLAADRDRLAAWRTPGPGSLRETMAASPLCDAKSFSARFQSAIRDAWRAWCAARGDRAGAAALRSP